MENTIKEELDRKFVSSHLVNDNSLLVVSKSKSNPTPIVSVRYIEDKCMKEDGIVSLISGTTVRYNEKILGIFISNSSGDGKKLVTVYDLKNHTFIENDLLNSVYYSKINDNDKPMQYLKRDIK